MADLGDQGRSVTVPHLVSQLSFVQQADHLHTQLYSLERYIGPTIISE